MLLKYTYASFAIRFLLPTLEMEVVVLCQTLLNFYQTKRCHISEGSNILSYHLENTFILNF